MLFAFSISVYRVNAQEVPQEILDLMVKVYTGNGYKLEKSFLPDFTRMHPTSMMTNTWCYPGKQIVVLSIMARKPIDWKYKVRQGDYVFEHTNVLTELELSGKLYYQDWIIAGFSANTEDSEYCLTYLAYDAEYIDLPVYTYIFSLNPK